MRWLVVGAGGMLGQDLVPNLRSRGYEVVPVDRAEIDITDPAATAGLADGFDVVANCAAYTAVDAAEAHEAAAFAVNAVGAANVARAARAAHAQLVQVSTDYVFGGRATAPYGEDDPIAPVSAYGRTKAAGEWAVRAEQPNHLIVRTAWLYGANGPCFPKTIARVARERGSLDVVDDQFGQPTWTVDLSDLICRLVEAKAPAGTYHSTSRGQGSWYDFARAVVGAAGMDPSIVRPATSGAVVRPAQRPAYSVLGHGALERAGITPIGEWRDRWSTSAAEVLSP